MKGNTQDKVFVYAPESAEEAARLFVECSRIKEGGREVRLGILESPYSPFCDFGGDGPVGIDTSVSAYAPDQDGAAPAAAQVRGSPGDVHLQRNFECFVKSGVHVIAGLEDLLESIEAEDESAGISIFISHKGMRSILEVSRRDLLAVVAGGARFIDFKRAVEEAGLYFPYEPFFAGGDATVAGIVMEGESARTDGRFGGLREYLLYAELVTPRGDVIHSGSRSVKDVGGYELLGFLAGSGGRCGMISRVALKLLPAPGSRMFFAVPGDTPRLKAMAERAHQGMRPAFLEIFEGEAAGMLAAGFRKHMPGAQYPAPEGGSPSALLLGELQSPGAGSVDRLARSASSIFGGGSSFFTLDSSLLSERGHFPFIMLDALDRGRGIIHVSYDSGPGPPDTAGMLVYRSLYPERIHCFISCGPDTPSGPRPETDALSIIGSVPGFVDLIAGILGKGLRERVEVVFKRYENPIRVRVHGSELYRFVTEGGGRGLLEGYEGARGLLEEMNEGIFKVFDPHGLMLP